MNQDLGPGAVPEDHDPGAAPAGEPSDAQAEASSTDAAEAPATDDASSEADGSEPEAEVPVEPTEPSEPVEPSEPAAPRSRTYGPAWLTIVGGAIVPGLGHLLLGRPRRAALLFAPILALAIAAIVVVLMSPDRADLAGELLSPDALEGLVIVVAIVGLYRLAVLGATVLLAARIRPTTRVGRAGRVLLAVALAIVVIAPHVLVGAVIADTRETVIEVFDPSDLGLGPDGPDPSFDGEIIPPLEPDTDLDEATPTSSASLGPTATATATPSPTPAPTPGPAWAADGRLDVLLIGADAGPDRWSLRTDTMILLSVDVATGRSAMFGFPRNMTGAPLPKESAGAVPGGRYPGLLNSIYVYANAHPSQFPGGRYRGFRAIGGTIQKLAGVRLDGIAVVNLNGFVRLVDALGGVTITIPRALHDDRYPLENGTGVVSIDFKAGKQHLNGHRALMYARSRHQDSDYGRMRRQQAVLAGAAEPDEAVQAHPEDPDAAQDRPGRRLDELQAEGSAEPAQPRRPDRCQARQDADVRAAGLPGGDQRRRDQADPQDHPRDLPVERARAHRDPAAGPRARSRGPDDRPDGRTGSMRLIATRARSAAGGAGRDGRRSAA